MSFAADQQQRLDALLALAQIFAPEPEAEGVAPAPDLSLFSALNERDRQALERRAGEVAAARPPEAARRFLRDSVRPSEEKLRAAYAELSAMVHPSYLIEALQAEPPRVRVLILPLLPAAALAEKNAPPVPPGNFRSGLDDGLLHFIRAAFLTQFVLGDQLFAPTDLDLLAGVEAVRLIRLLGVRETAIACRGISAVEAVAAFLRRFAAEDARAIAAHIAALTRIASDRVQFAEVGVHRELSAEYTGEAMLDRVGSSLLAVALAGRDETTLKYNLQKFPLAGADTLRQLIDVARTRNADPQIARQITQEVELLATRVRRTGPPRGATDVDGALLLAAT